MTTYPITMIKCDFKCIFISAPRATNDTDVNSLNVESLYLFEKWSFVQYVIRGAGEPEREKRGENAGILEKSHKVKKNWKMAEHGVKKPKLFHRREDYSFI